MITPTTARLFIAIPLHDKQRTIMSAWSEQLKKRTHFKKWVHPNDWHITIKYLGETRFDQAQQVKQRLREVTAQLTPFQLSIEQLGIFGQPSKPRIFWAGVEGELDTLHHVQAQVEEQMIALGYDAENRAYNPHLTLARQYIGDEPFEEGWLNEWPQPNQGDITLQVKEIVLYQSHSGRTPMYQPLAVFPLGR